MYTMYANAHIHIQHVHTILVKAYIYILLIYIYHIYHTGVATTFINKDVEESSLLDLKHLLIEAKQRVPPVLLALQDPDDDLVNINGVKGCAFCGGLGHRITECPKLDKDARRIGANKKDALTGNDW